MSSTPRRSTSIGSQGLPTSLGQRGLPRPSPNVPLRSPRLAPLPPRPDAARKSLAVDASVPSVAANPFEKYLRLPRINGAVAVLSPHGPYAPGDTVLYELLDDKAVWQWRIGRLLRPSSANDRVCYIVPLVPTPSLSPDTGHWLQQRDALPPAAREEAERAMDALRDGHAAAMARQSELADLAGVLSAERESIREMAGSIDGALAKVLPLLEEARVAVGNITSTDLSEMRSYRTPPPIVMRVLEAVMLILENYAPKAEVKWKEVTQFCKSNDFVPRVRDFGGSMSKDTYHYVKKVFLDDTSFTADAASRASAAAGPLYQWVHAQMGAAVVHSKVAPLLTRHASAMEQLNLNEAKQVQVIEEQSRLHDRVSGATGMYQRALFGFDFLVPRGAGSSGLSDGSLSSVAERVLAAAASHTPFTGWVPSPHLPPQSVLASSIMAKCQ